jgi:hypothetical protein
MMAGTFQTLCHREPTLRTFKLHHLSLEATPLTFSLINHRTTYSEGCNKKASNPLYGAVLMNNACIYFT